MASKTQHNAIQTLVIRGLVLGYAYSILLSASAIAVCETKRPGQCSDVWSQGFSTAAGLVTTFLAYLISPPEALDVTRKKEETDASS